MTYFNYRIPYSGYVTLARSILESITLLSVRVYLLPHSFSRVLTNSKTGSPLFSYLSMSMPFLS